MTVSAANSILIATIAALAPVAAAWIHGMMDDSLRRRSVRRAAIYRCETCGHVYEDSRRVPLSGCERCGTLNEAVRQ